MRNLHQMVINDISKVVRRIAIRFDKNHIIQLFIIHRNISEYNIMESSRTLCRNILTNYIRNTCRKLFLYFFLTQVKAVLVIFGNLFYLAVFLFFGTAYFCFKTLQTFLVTKAIVSISFFNQFLRIFQVDSLRLTLTLYIRTITGIFVRSFIMDQSGSLHGTVYNIKGTLHITFLIRIFYS